MQIGDILELEIIAYDHEGIGIAKKEGFPIFIEKTVIGDIVRARVNYMSSRLAKAELIEIVKESINREHNQCAYANECGGCNIFHMTYEEQLRFKKQMVIDTLYKVGKIQTIVHDVTPNPSPLHYRNKVIVPLGMENGKIISGFYEPKSHKIVNQDQCLIEHHHASKIIETIKDLLKKYDISIYDETSHTNVARNIMLRVNNNNEFMVILIVRENKNSLKNLLNELYESDDTIKSVYLNVNDKKTNVILNPTGFMHIAGDKTIIEEMNGLKFHVHPNSFLQVNHKQALALYNKALDYVDTNNDVIIDAYCGIGTITLNLAKKSKEVYGIEIVPEAIKNANENKKINKIDNAHFICGKCEDEIIKLKDLKNVNTIVFDPPRKGCDIKFLDTVISMKIDRIIYISCQTSTFARDAKILIDAGYELKEVYPFDLFSQTAHVENLGYFVRIKK